MLNTSTLTPSPSSPARRGDYLATRVILKLNNMSDLANEDK